MASRRTWDAMRCLRRRLTSGLGMGLLAAACSDRPVGEPEDPPDIEGLCKEYCVRVMACVWTPDIGATFSTEEGCRHNCAADVVWDDCPRENEAMFACITQYDCPQFGEGDIIIPGCQDEFNAVNGCNE